MTQTIKSELQNNGGVAAIYPSFFSEDILYGAGLNESGSYCWSMEAAENSSERIKSFRDLMVWQMSIDLVTDIYKLTQFLPIEERYGDRCSRSNWFNWLNGYWRNWCDRLARGDRCSRSNWFNWLNGYWRNWCDR